MTINNQEVTPTSPVYRDVLTPLSERIAKDQPELLPGLTKLKTAMESDKFTKYVERLSAIKVTGDTLWLTTRSGMDRSILERDYHSQLKEAFQVKRLQIVCL